MGDVGPVLPAITYLAIIKYFMRGLANKTYRNHPAQPDYYDA